MYKKSKAVSKALSKVWKVCEVLIRFTFVFFLANLHSTRSALQQAWSFSVTLEQGFSTEGSLQEGKKGSLHSQRHRPPLTGGTHLKSPASRVIRFVGPKGVLVCLTRGVTRSLLNPIKATLVNPVQYNPGVNYLGCLKQKILPKHTLSIGVCKSPGKPPRYTGAALKRDFTSQLCVSNLNLTKVNL